MEEKPPPQDHPLLRIDNVLMSPRTAGATVESRKTMARIAAKQMPDILGGKRAPQLVNPGVWPAYRERFAEVIGAALRREVMASDDVAVVRSSIATLAGNHYEWYQTASNKCEDPVAGDGLDEKRAVVTLAINVARSLTRDGFKRDIILRVFRFLRTNDVARTKYLSAAKCETGFEQGQEEKATLNSMIGRGVAQSFGAHIQVARTVDVEGEFCESYSELLPP